MRIPVRTTILSLLLSLVALPVVSFAQGEEKGVGTIIIEQKSVRSIFGEWGLATPVGPVEGTGAYFEENGRIEGTYSLNIDSPSGAVPRVVIYNDGEVTEELNDLAERATVSGVLGSGGTLKFEISYDFILLGTVNVGSSPQGIAFQMVHPNGTVVKDVTPSVYNNVPKGSYAVYYFPTMCPTPRPVSRELKPNKRISFNYEPQCHGYLQPTSEPEVEPEPEEPEPEPEAPREPSRRVKNPVRIALSSSTKEVTKGGSARYVVRVVNTGDGALNGTTVQFRYDSSKLTIEGARTATQSPGMLTWNISTLPEGGRWEQAFTGRPTDAATAGSVISTSMSVAGSDLKDMNARMRTDSVQVSVIGSASMPKTGASMEMILALIMALALTPLVMFVLARKAVAVKL